MEHIIRLGEVLIDLIPSTRVHLAEACYTPYPGGAIANVAVALARLGGSSRGIGGVSDDEFGQLLVRVLVDNHVDTHSIRVIKQAPTAIALITLDTQGQTRFTFFRQNTADSQLQAGDVDWSAWHDAASCHVGGVLLSTEPARTATLAAMNSTREVGSIVSLDANIRPAFWSSHSDIHNTLTQAIERTDILKLSAEEATFMSEQSNLPKNPYGRSWLKSLGEALLERGPLLVLITLGAEGALLLTTSHQVEVPARTVRPLDTTGAGDAFMGAAFYTFVQEGYVTPADLLSLSENSLKNLGNFASFVAGLSGTSYGGMSSVPFIHEVNDFSTAQEQGKEQ